MAIAKTASIKDFQKQGCFYEIKECAKIITALNHGFRQQIILLLEQQELTVTELYVFFRCEQSVMSQHLAILRRHKIVGARRDGKNIFYSVDRNRLLGTIAKVEQLVEWTI